MNDLGVVTWPEPRRDRSHLAAKRFPVLATQVRCSTGFTHWPTGVQVVPVTRPIPVAAAQPKPAQTRAMAVLEALGAAAALSDTLPAPSDLYKDSGLSGRHKNPSSLVSLLLDQLVKSGEINMRLGPIVHGKTTPREITLRDGRVLRSPDMPRQSA